MLHFPPFSPKAITKHYWFCWSPVFLPPAGHGDDVSLWCLSSRTFAGGRYTEDSASWSVNLHLPNSVEGRLPLTQPPPFSPHGWESRAEAQEDGSGKPELPKLSAPRFGKQEERNHDHRWKLPGSHFGPVPFPF